MSKYAVSLNITMASTEMPFCDQVAAAVKLHAREQRKGMLGASGSKEYHIPASVGFAPVTVDWSFREQEA